MREGRSHQPCNPQERHREDSEEQDGSARHVVASLRSFGDVATEAICDEAELVEGGLEVVDDFLDMAPHAAPLSSPGEEQ
jgi:hypothetical protein